MGAIVLGGWNLLKAVPRPFWIALAIILVVGGAYRWHQSHVGQALEQADTDGFNRAKRQFEAAQKLAAAEHLKRAQDIERKANELSKEASNEYAQALADIGRRAADLRVRNAQARAQGVAGGSDLPGLPDAAGEPDGAAFADIVLTDAAITALAEAEINTAKLVGLQKWINDQIALHNKGEHDATAADAE